MIRAPHSQILLLGILATVYLVLSEKILDLDITLYKKWGLLRLHETVSKHRAAWLILMRVVFAFCIAGSLIALYILD